MCSQRAYADFLSQDAVNLISLWTDLIDNNGISEILVSRQFVDKSSELGFILGWEFDVRVVSAFYLTSDRHDCRISSVVIFTLHLQHRTMIILEVQPTCKARG